MNIRTYGLIYDEKYLTSGREGLVEINKYLKDAKDLAEKDPELSKLKENGKTIIMIEHNRSKAQEISDAVFFLANGKIH